MTGFARTLQVALALAASAWPQSQSPQAGLAQAPLTLPNGRIIQVELALTPRQREVGLMFRRKLPRDYGMLFVFPQEQELEFWMKNTLVDLDMLFLDRDGRITAAHARVPRSTVHTSEKRLARRSGRGQYVLELPAGAASRYKLKPGHRLKFAITAPPS